MHYRLYSFVKKQIFRVEKLVGLPPKLELLAVFIYKSGHSNMSNNVTKYTKYEHTVSLRLGHTDTLCINFSFFESLLF